MSNMAIVKEFFNSLEENGFEATLSALPVKGKWVTADMSRNFSVMGQLGSALELKIVGGKFKFDIHLMTSESDRVSVELTTTAQLNDGKLYTNWGHFLLLFKEGKILEIHEHCDTLHAKEIWGSLSS
jgi:ketosteroid isomerase-like protein